MFLVFDGVRAFCDTVIYEDDGRIMSLVAAYFSGTQTTVKSVVSAFMDKHIHVLNLENGPKESLVKGYKRWRLDCGFKAIVSKKRDLAEAVVLSNLITNLDLTNPIVLAEHGNLKDVVFARIKKIHPYPLLDEWKDWMYDKMVAAELVKELKVLSVSRHELRAARLKIETESIEDIVHWGFDTGHLSIPDGSGEASIGGVSAIGDYLGAWGGVLGDDLLKKYQARHNPGVDPIGERILELKRKPLRGQAEVAMALVKTLQARRTVAFIGEPGIGKTITALAAGHQLLSPEALEGVPAYRVLVMTPGHLTLKWKREIEITIAKAKVVVIKDYKDALKLRSKFATQREPSCPEYYVLGKDAAKLSYYTRRAARWSQRRDGWICPDCGSVQGVTKKETEDGIIRNVFYPAKFEDFDAKKASNSKCCKCGTKLWAADRELVRRVAPADVLKKYLTGKFDLFIADELHKYFGDSAQGIAFGNLVGVAKKTIALTGTLLGGYSSHLFKILFRLDPKALTDAGFSYNSVGQWVAEYGAVEKVYRTREDDTLRKTSKGGKKVSTNERPGVNPKVFGRFLFGSCVFLEMSDLAEELPSYNEFPVEVEMDADLAVAYKEVEKSLKAEMERRWAKGKPGIFGTYLNSLLAYPDKPYNNPPVLDPETDAVVLELPELLSATTYQKEKELINLIIGEKAKKRRCIVYANYTGRRDVTERLAAVLAKEGLKVDVLKAKVTGTKREQWLADSVVRGVDVVICNPTLIAEGLDCIDFPTEIFHQTGYNLFTLRQAARRSFRVIQTKPVRVYFMYYKDTLQEAAIRLMGAKLKASLALEGSFSEEGLRALSSGDDMTSALCKALVKGLDDIETAEAIWGKVGYGKIAEDEIDAEVVEESETVVEKSEAKPKSTVTGIVAGKAGGVLKANVEVLPTGVEVVEFTVVSRKKDTTDMSQLGWNFDLAQDA